MYVSDSALSTVNPRQKIQISELSVKHRDADFALNSDVWPNHILLSIGKFLFHIIVMDLRVDVNSIRKDAKNK